MSLDEREVMAAVREASKALMDRFPELGYVHTTVRWAPESEMYYDLKTTRGSWGPWRKYLDSDDMA